MKPVMTVTIGDKVYEMGAVTATALLNAARDKYKKENAFALIGVEKKGYLEMRHDVFSDKLSLLKHVRAYRQKGFTVHSVMAGGQP